MKRKQKVKLIKGRDEYLKKTTGHVCKLAEGIDIYVDPYQYILRIDGSYNKSYYFASLEDLFVELFEMKVKELLVKNLDKTLDGAKESIKKAQKWIKKISTPLSRA